MTRQDRARLREPVETPAPLPPWEDAESASEHYYEDWFPRRPRLGPLRVALGAVARIAQARFLSTVRAGGAL